MTLSSPKRQILFFTFSFMLDKEDIALLRGMFSDVKHEMRDEIHSVVNAAVFALEQRMMKEFERVQKEFDRVQKEFERVHEEIEGVKDAVIDLVDETIMPKIEDNRLEIVAIKRHLSLA